MQLYTPGIFNRTLVCVYIVTSLCIGLIHIIFLYRYLCIR
nr:MAG TPA: hypothetical protein [Caudoviricetes sp.]DAT07318.1 MAG TPA: hypothetical protein [Caudoviricetes sp.]